jgi:hypothetical protein
MIKQLFIILITIIMLKCYKSYLSNTIMVYQIKLYAFFLFVIFTVVCQSPYDDEVMISIPGYRNAIYSGNL